YKTGKCFNERTLKRNGDAHSLCEEHRIKQNLIQRRSDRKYQTVHAIRRRERSQRRAVLKKQVSMAVAQQLFYEHQQQKTLGIPLPQDHPLHLLTANSSAASTPAASGLVALAPPIQIPAPSSSAFLMDGGRALASTHSPLVLSFQQQAGRRGGRKEASSVKTAAYFKASSSSQATNGKGDEASPTGIDDFTPESFLNISMPCGHNSQGGSGTDEEDSDCSSEESDSFSFMPIVSCAGEKETWSDDDIEFLQTILLA
ncbi:hypothetical protein BBJ28_00022722, partial [Nothophytophthora sp. Chile5]